VRKMDEIDEERRRLDEEWSIVLLLLYRIGILRNVGSRSDKRRLVCVY